MVEDPSILNRYERLSWRLGIGGEISNSELGLAAALKLFPPGSFNSVPFAIAASVHEQATALLVADPTYWVVPLLPGMALAGHPGTSHLDFSRNSQECVYSGESTTFLLTRDGRRPGRLTVNSMANKDYAEYLRFASLCAARVRHRPNADSQMVGAIWSATRALAEGDFASLTDIAHKVPPRDTLDEIAELMFGVAWDLAQLVCSDDASNVAVGAYGRPDIRARLLRSRLAVLQEVGQIYCAPLAADPRRVRVHVVEWARQGAFDARSRALVLVDALCEMLTLWSDSFLEELAHVLIQTGFLLRRQNRAFRAILASQATQLPGRNVLAKQVFALGCGTAARRLELGHEQEESHETLVRRIRGARLVGGLGVAKAAQVAGTSVSRARRVLSSSPARPDVSAVLTELGQRQSTGPMTLRDWQELWRRGELPISIFDDVRALSNSCSAGDDA